MATAENTAAFDFPMPSGTQQDPTQVSLMTAATGGTELYRDDLTLTWLRQRTARRCASGRAH